MTNFNHMTTLPKFGHITTLIVKIIVKIIVKTIIVKRFRNYVTATGFELTTT